MILDTSKLKPTSSLVLKMKAITKFFKNDGSISGLQQFCILMQVMALKIARNRIVLWIQLFHYVLCGLFIGLIFLNSANDGNRMFDHLKYCIACTFFTVYTQCMVPILDYPAEVKLVKKEWFNRWYGLAPYYIALSISRLPVQLVLNLVFSTLVYTLSGQPLEWWRFGSFAVIGMILSVSAEGLGLAIGAKFSVTNGCAIGPAVMAPLLGLAIHGFDFAPDITLVMDILMRMSFIRGGVVAMVLTVFGFDRPKLECAEIYCHFDNPKVLLRYLRIEERSLAAEIGVLCALMLAFRILCYYSLRKRFYK
jgi:ATP-binding cassette, subfamily G (WHITE), member 1